MQPPKPLIFFDGLCHLCNGFVNRVIARDPKGIFQWAPLQGETAKNILTPEEARTFTSLILYENQRKFYRSEAVLRILIRLGGPYKLFLIAFLIPRFLRDALYEAVAQRRYGWFGQSPTCRRPTPQDQDRLLP